MNTESVTTRSTQDSDGELTIDVLGDIRIHVEHRYDRVELEFTVRGSERKVLVRDTTYVELDHVSPEGIVNFSGRCRVPADVASRAATLEVRCVARVIISVKPLEISLPAPVVEKGFSF